MPCVDKAVPPCITMRLLFPNCIPWQLKMVGSHGPLRERVRMVGGLSGWRFIVRRAAGWRGSDTSCSPWGNASVGSQSFPSCCTFRIGFAEAKEEWQLTSETLMLLFSHSVMSDSLDPMDCITPGFPVFHYLWESAQTQVH